MSRLRISGIAAVGITLGTLLAFAPFALADDAAKSREVTSTFTVTGMT